LSSSRQITYNSDFKTFIIISTMHWLIIFNLDSLNSPQGNNNGTNLVKKIEKYKEVDSSWMHDR
jgi:hypothetical protein